MISVTAMNRKSAWRHGAGLVVLTVVGVAGCQHVESPGGRALLFGDLGQRISARQAADVQVALGRSLEKRGQPDPAMAAYAEALRRDPKRTEAYWRLAVLHDRQANFKTSAEMFRKALQTSPGNPEIYADMGYSLYLQRRWAEAEMNLRQALALKPDNARAHNNLGLVLAHSDRPEEALAEFRKTGSEADARVNLALALCMEGQWDEARAHYQAALAANPQSASARKGLWQLDTVLVRVPPAPGPAAVEGPVQRVTALAPDRIRPQRSPVQTVSNEVNRSVEGLHTADAKAVALSDEVSQFLISSPRPEDRWEAPRLSQARTFFRLPPD